MVTEIRVLLTEDDEDDYIIVRDLFKEIDHHKFHLDWAPSYDEGLATIGQRKHDVYLVDFQLGKHTGLELVKTAIAQGCEAPLIILTGQNDIEIDEQLRRAGASDYLIKGTISAQQLERSIRYSISQANHVKEIKNLNTYLENRVRDRTLILEEAMNELERSREELSMALEREKEINELKTRFVSMASHEFRTPLTTIQSSLSLISKYSELNDREKLHKHIERIKSSIHNLTDLLNDVLSVSKLEEGKVLAHHEMVHIPESLHDIIEQMQTICKPGQHISYQHSGNDTIVLDHKILKHILLNLISNAIKFSGDDGLVTVTTSIENNVFKLTVTDNGLGISDDDQKHLFDRFFRGKNVTNIQGTGLGLNIVANYIKLLNGEITFSSKLGKGTSFFVTLPAWEEF